MGSHATCAVQRAADDALELSHGALPVVVPERGVELRRERQLLLGDIEPLVDLSLALGRAGTEPALPLLAVRRPDEDRHRRRHPARYGERAVRLDLEHGRVARGGDPIELRPERARAVALAPGQLDP